MAAADQVLEDLDPEQREVATSLLGPVCVLAGAGTGKTRAITHRIAYGVRTGTYAPGAVLAVTFTARAAGEMRSRLRDLGVAGVSARTFHAAALRQLSYFLPRAERRQVPKLLDHKAGVVAQAAARLGWEVDRAMVRDLAAEIEWAKVNLLAPDQYRTDAVRLGRGEVAGLDATAISRLMALYDETLGELDAMDFEDVMLITLGLLQEHRDVAEEVQRQYRYFVVDEFQDVSPLANALLRAWLGRGHQLCVVGDPNQTIYSFAGATDIYLRRFTSTYSGATVINLVRDYRSTPQVVSLANSLLRAARKGGAELVAQRPSGPAPRFSLYQDDDDEAHGVATRIGALISQGVPAGDIAVLYRTNAQSEPFEQALAHQGISYLVRGGERFFSRKEVRDAIVLLRGAAVGTSDAPVGGQVRSVLTSLGWTPQPPAQRGQVRERWESLQALVSLADDIATRPDATLRDVVEELDARAQVQHAPSFGGVTLASLHAAKGLEWQAVFLVGLSDGLLPISLAASPADLDEERRLLYVGITRAREHLELSYAAARNPGGRASRRVSRFLATLWPQPRREAGGRPSGELTAAQADLAQHLRQWRAQTARSLDRPDFSVLHDITLEQVARRAPASLQDLAGISGLGPVKLRAYGQGLVDVVAQWRKTHPE